VSIAVPSVSLTRKFDAAEDEASYTARLRAKVQRAMDDPRPRIRRSIEKVAQQKAQGGI